MRHSGAKPTVCLERTSWSGHHQDTGPDSRISLTGAGNVFQLTINRIRIGGQYSCVLADKEDVQIRVSRNISLDVGVDATVR